MNSSNTKDYLNYGVLAPRGWYWRKIYEMTVISPQYKPLVLFWEWMFFPLAIIIGKVFIETSDISWKMQVIAAILGYSVYCNIKVFWYDRLKEKAMAQQQLYYGK